MKFDILITMHGWSNERKKANHMPCVCLEVSHWYLIRQGYGQCALGRLLALQESDEREDTIRVYFVSLDSSVLPSHDSNLLKW